MLCFFPTLALIFKKQSASALVQVESVAHLRPAGGDPVRTAASSTGSLVARLLGQVTAVVVNNGQTNTHTHTQTRSLQYFAPLLEEE